MTKQTAQQYLHLVQALADGKQIQYNLEDKWFDATDLSLALASDRYRIKPEPIKQEFYYIVHNATTLDIGPYLYAYKDISGARKYLNIIDPNGEKYVIMHANASSMPDI